MEKYIINKNSMKVEYYENNKMVWSYTIKEREVKQTITHLKDYKATYEVIEKIPSNEVEEKTEKLVDIIDILYKEDITNFSIDYDICDNETFGHIYFETYKNFAVSICVSYDYDIDKLIFELDTRNLNRKQYGIYEDMNKNKKTVKTLKGVLGYIEKYMVLEQSKSKNITK